MATSPKTSTSWISARLSPRTTIPLLPPGPGKRPICSIRAMVPIETNSVWSPSLLVVRMARMTRRSYCLLASAAATNSSLRGMLITVNGSTTVALRLINGNVCGSTSWVGTDTGVFGKSTGGMNVKSSLIFRCSFCSVIKPDVVPYLHYIGYYPNCIYWCQ